MRRASPPSEPQPSARARGRRADSRADVGCRDAHAPARLVRARGRLVGLGCNNFGGRIDEAASRAVIDAALDAGVTFFDTADVYGNRGGSEEIIGRALGRRATGSCSRRSSVTTSATARPPAARGPTSARRSRPRCAGCRPTGSTSTSTTAPTGSRRSTRRWARSTSSSRREGARDRLVQLHRRHGRGGARDRAERLGPPVRLRAERVLVARARRGAGAAPDLRAARDRLHPLLPARERPPHRQVQARASRPRKGRGCTAASSTTTASTHVERLRAFASDHGVSLLEVAIGGLLAPSAVVSVIAGATKPEQVRANAAASGWEPAELGRAPLSRSCLL